MNVIESSAGLPVSADLHTWVAVLCAVLLLAGLLALKARRVRRAAAAALTIGALLIGSNAMSSAATAVDQQATLKALAASAGFDMVLCEDSVQCLADGVTSRVLLLDNGQSKRGYILRTGKHVTLTGVDAG